jgi:tRNA(fMet)-specific endonuclease VapC
MNGIKCLLDTNALISFLQGNPKLSSLASADAITISIITILEFLSFKEISEPDKKLLADLLELVDVVELTRDNGELIEIISAIRTTYKIKLPDAIIAATAIYKDAVLVTNDKGFSKISKLTILTY